MPLSRCEFDYRRGGKEGKVNFPILTSGARRGFAPEINAETESDSQKHVCISVVKGDNLLFYSVSAG